jgi:Tfp pilus assembly protein PilV
MRFQNPCNFSRATRSRSGPLRMLAGTEAGFTIIEVVITAVLVAMIAGGTATALVSTSSFSGDQRRRSQAVEIAQQDQERMRGMSARGLAGYSQTRTVGPYDGTSYTVLSTGQFLSNTGASSCTSSGTGAAAYILITSDVTWASNARPSVREQSLITPPTGGTMLTKVVDQNNAAVSGVNVTATGPDPSTATEVATTGSEGCVVFGAMDTGDYEISLAKSGYVDPNGDATPTPAPLATISGSGTSFPNGNPFQFGLAGNVSATFTANNGALTGQHAPSLSVSNAGRALPLITTPASPGTPITTTTTLFPFTTAYTVWAGKCTGEQPPSGANRITSSVGPGATATPAIKEPALNVTVQYPSGTNKKPAGMKLYYNQSAGGSCSESWLPAINAAAGPNPPTNGWLASPGQPFAGSTTVGSTTYNGSYNVCASYNTGSGLRYGMNVGVSNSNFTSATATTVPISDTNQFTATYISGAGSCP